MKIYITGYYAEDAEDLKAYRAQEDRPAKEIELDGINRIVIGYNKVCCYDQLGKVEFIGDRRSIGAVAINDSMIPTLRGAEFTRVDMTQLFLDKMAEYDSDPDLETYVEEHFEPETVEEDDQ